MYRILVVDDEPYIVDWISDIIEINSGLEADIYRAYSAFDALKWLEKAKIDILITDICMPAMDGIELLERVNNTWPYCKVILITGHEEFDYAYTAIRNNIVSYILKTEEDERILDEVKKAAAIIDSELANIEIIKTARQKVKEASHIILRDCFKRMVRGESDFPMTLKEQYYKYDLNIDFSLPFFLAIGRIDDLPDEASEFDKYDCIMNIENIAEHFLSSHIISESIEYEHLKMVWFLQPRDMKKFTVEHGISDDMWRRTGKFILGMSESIQQSCKETLLVNISFALSSAPVKYFDFAERFEYLEQMLYMYANTKSNALITDSVFMKSNNNEMLYTDENLEKIYLKLNRTDVLKSYLENGRKDSFLEAISDICECLRTVKSKNNNKAHEIYYSIALMFLSYINRRNMDKSIAFKIELNKLTRPDDHKSWNDAVNYLYKLSSVIFELQNYNQNCLTMDLITYLKNYIQEHIEQDVSLVKLSEITGYNPSYLSRLYKTSTGENLYEYISKARIDKAKQLLAESSKNINEISVKVGFESRICFNRFFKRITTMSPQEYRSSVQLSK